MNKDLDRLGVLLTLLLEKYSDKIEFDKLSEPHNTKKDSEQAEPSNCKKNK